MKIEGSFDGWYLASKSKRRESANRFYAGRYPDGEIHWVTRPHLARFFYLQSEAVLVSDEIQRERRVPSGRVLLPLRATITLRSL